MRRGGKNCTINRPLSEHVYKDVDNCWKVVDKRKLWNYDLSMPYLMEFITGYPQSSVNSKYDSEDAQSVQGRLDCMIMPLAAPYQCEVYRQ